METWDGCAEVTESLRCALRRLVCGGYLVRCWYNGKERTLPAQWVLDACEAQGEGDQPAHIYPMPAGRRPRAGKPRACGRLDIHGNRAFELVHPHHPGSAPRLLMSDYFHRQATRRAADR